MKMKNCHHCGYCRKWKNGTFYCDDLDCTVDPDEPICSDENYES